MLGFYLPMQQSLEPLLSIHKFSAYAEVLVLPHTTLSGEHTFLSLDSVYILHKYC